MLDTILEIIIIVLLVVVIVMLVALLLRKNATINVKEDLKDVKDDINRDISNLKNELDNKLNNVQQSISDSVNKDLTNFSSFNKQNMESLTNTLSSSLKELREDNNKELDKIRNTVDEKLEKTLNSRLAESFKAVQDNLTQVEQGLGEMKNLATGVGDLKKVLSNVKTRGIWGEMQLSQILSQVLNREQYDENVRTRPGSKDPVEFAIKLPGDGTDVVRLPIDSKFPLDTYSNVVDAYDTMDKDKIDSAISELKTRIKKCAKDIHDKYIEPPYTTDFGIMFLPIEALYAEVVKSGIIEELQNDYRVIVTGPTTMAALLNSLQVGFRTLAIQKRSSEVWKTLAAVKAEFGTFEDVLKKAQKKISDANKDIENLVGTRTRQMQKKLKDVEVLDLSSASAVLALDDNDIEDSEEEVEEN